MIALQDDLFSHPPYQPGSETSKQAAEEIIPHVSRLQRVVFLAVQSRGSLGATRKEVESITGLLTQTVTPRLNELEHSGLIRKQRQTVHRDGGTVFETVTREKCAVYVVEGPR